MRRCSGRNIPKTVLLVARKYFTESTMNVMGGAEFVGNSAQTTAALHKAKFTNKNHLEICHHASFRPTKDPVVLCHGLFGYDSLFEGTMFQMRYWNKIEEALKKLGCEIHTSRVGTASSLKRRSEQLHSFLDNKLRGRRINLIGHSMVLHNILIIFRAV